MMKNNKHTCNDCIHNEVCEWAIPDKTLFSCDDYINQKEHEFYEQFMKIWKESDFPEEIEMYTSELLIQLGINEDIDDDK